MTEARPTFVLVGPPGAGKSSVGRLLAEATGVPFRDTDADVEQTAGRSIPDIFFEEGEDGFRHREALAVAAALASHPGVLSLGGGAVLRPETRELLRGHRVVYLSVDLGEAATRVGLSASRPLLAVNPRATLRALMAERAPVYTDLATLTVDTTGRDPHEVVTAILAEGGP